MISAFISSSLTGPGCASAWTGQRGEHVAHADEALGADFVQRESTREETWKETREGICDRPGEDVHRGLRGDDQVDAGARKRARRPMESSTSDRANIIRSASSSITQTM